MSLKDPDIEVIKLQQDDADDGVGEFIVELADGSRRLEHWAYHNFSAHHCVAKNTLGSADDLFYAFDDTLTPSQRYWLLGQIASCISSEPLVEPATESFSLGEPGRNYLPFPLQPANTPELCELVQILYRFNVNRVSDTSLYEGVLKRVDELLNEDSSVGDLYNAAYCYALYGLGESVENAKDLLKHAVSKADSSNVSGMLSDIESGEFYYNLVPRALLFGESNHPVWLSDLASLSKTDDYSCHQLQAEFLLESRDYSDCTLADLIVLLMQCNVVISNIQLNGLKCVKKTISDLALAKALSEDARADYLLVQYLITDPNDYT